MSRPSHAVRITVDRAEIERHRADKGTRPVWILELPEGEKRVDSAELKSARLVSANGGRAVWIEVAAEDIKCPD